MMKSRHPSFGLAALTFGQFCTVDDASAADSLKLNIVLIMTDDQGYGDLGITGNPVLETPHIPFALTP